MEGYNRNCSMLNDSIYILVNSFVLKYYEEDAHVIRIDCDNDCLHYNLQINDEYRNIDEIYTALWYDIPKKILFEYKEESFAYALRKETFINLKNFYLMKK
jgi:hypothetical protein